MTSPTKAPTGWASGLAPSIRRTVAVTDVPLAVPDPIAASISLMSRTADSYKSRPASGQTQTAGGAHKKLRAEMF
jgi:hypothetical protein